jgi:hypothetical protein
LKKWLAYIRSNGYGFTNDGKDTIRNCILKIWPGAGAEEKKGEHVVKKAISMKDNTLTL